MQKLTNKEEESCRYYGSLKAFVKEVMAEITESTTLQHSRLL
jgi:hypothetical protein